MSQVVYQHVHDGELLTSRDSKHMDRTFLESWLRPGLEPGQWSYGSNMPGAGIVPTGEAEISIYVSAHFLLPNNRIDRYTLQTDGFASVNAPYSVGELLTRLLRFTGTKLVINVATSVAGGLRVAIEDETGTPMPGRALGDCEEVVGNQIARTVRWKNGSDLASLAGRTVRLRIVMKDADLFSLRFGG